MKRQNRDITSFFNKKINKKSGESSNFDHHQPQENTPNSLSIVNAPPSQALENPQSEGGETIGVYSTPIDGEVSFDDEERLSAIDVINLPQDPGKRKRLSAFHPNDRDIVRRAYLQRELCQPKDYEFPQRLLGIRERRFNPEWFQKHKSWLEYSVEKDAVFCFSCYLFKNDNVKGGDAFVGAGFRAWKKTEMYQKHVGGHMSGHNQAVRSLEYFKNQKGSLLSCLNKQSKQIISNYNKRLLASVKCLRWLLLQGLPVRGHRESEDSLNRGNFIELLKFYAMDNLDVHKVILENAPQNCLLTSPKIKKDIINACAKETTKSLLEELGDGFFAILAYESADISDKEQMALCLRYVNKRGEVTERFLVLVHIPNTTTLTLKGAIESLLMVHSLTFSSVRGQGYDGASNMQGSPKRKEFLRQKQAEDVVKVLSLGELESGVGLNQELSLSRPSDTRSGSHFKTTLNVINLYPTILKSLDAIGEVSDSVDKNKAESLTHLLMSFDFVFLAHLMVDIFGITNELNLALQRSDQDVVNAMLMVDVAKMNLQHMRENGWESLFDKVTSL